MASDVSLPNSPHLGGNRRQLGRETLQGMGMSRPRYISREGGQFRFVDEAGNETPAPGFNPQDGPYVDVVIVDANPAVSRIYFEGAYAGKGGQPPACWSDNGIAPSVNALIPQAAKCEPGVCPQLVKKPIGYNGFRQMYRSEVDGLPVDGVIEPVSSGGGAWADNFTYSSLAGAQGRQNGIRGGACMVNCTSNDEIYSFHPGGANALFVDGSVHFIKDVASVQLVAALVTRAGGEIISSDQY